MPKNSKNVYIEHFVVEAWGILEEDLANEKILLNKAMESAQKMRLTIVNSFIHRFEPYGLSLVLVISESHLAIHTWPELSYMNIDVLSCSKDTDLKNIKKVIKEVFSPSKIRTKEIKYS